MHYNPELLTIHADRGTSMRSKLVAQLLADLGVTKTHSRPQVSNDTPFSESQFKPLKYRPGFPKRFGAQEDARTFCARFFRWYNHDHHHHGIALLTPFQVHYGHAQATLEARQKTLDAAYLAHPERFPRKPTVSSLPEQVWINPPDHVSATSPLPGATCDSGTIPGEPLDPPIAEIENHASIASPVSLLEASAAGQ